MKYNYRNTVIELVQGDISKQEVDLIVNAANAELAGGSGVDGAIHQAGGPEIAQECARIIAERGTSLTAGQCALTTGGKLRCKFISHAVGPIWSGGNSGEYVALERTVENSMELAAANGCKSIAFPAISTGAYGFPMKEASLISLSAIFRIVAEKPGAFSLIRVVLWSDAAYAQFEASLQKIIRTQIGTSAADAHGHG